MLNVHFTKSILDGARKGAQLREVAHCENAVEGVDWAMTLGSGVHFDHVLKASYTAHGFRFETELAHDLAECGGPNECAWCREQMAYAAADTAYDLRGGN